MTRALVSTSGLAALLLAGCSVNSFIVGAQTHTTGAPANATAIYAVQDCQSMTSTGTKAVQDGSLLYLARDASPPGLYGLDAAGSGLRIENHWVDAEGDHFFFHVRLGHGFHYVFPAEAARPAVAYSYEGINWSTQEEGGVVKPIGVPSWKCPLVKQPTAEELEQRRVAEAPRASAGGGKHILAVFSIEDRGANLGVEVQERLSDYLTSTLAASGRFQVIPRSLLKERLVQQKSESYKECYDQSCQIELGKELAAERSLSTQVIRLGATCTVTTVFYDLKSAASEGGTSVDGGCTEEEIFRSMKDAVSRITSAR
jgi:hypothetical protein